MQAKPLSTRIAFTIYLSAVFNKDLNQLSGALHHVVPSLQIFILTQNYFTRFLCTVQAVHLKILFPTGKFLCQLIKTIVYP